MNLPQKGRALHLYRCQQGSPLSPAGSHGIAPVEIYKPPCGAMQVAPQGGFIVRMGMLFRGGEGYEMRIPLFPYCHFERKREIFFVRGQAKDVRIAASGKHRASRESEGRCFMQTALRKKTETGNEKDPSAALGMTKRGKAYLTFFFN